MRGPYAIIMAKRGKAEALVDHLEFEAKVQRTGTSKGIVIPAWRAKAMGLEEGETVQVMISRRG